MAEMATRLAVFVITGGIFSLLIWWIGSDTFGFDYQDSVAVILIGYAILRFHHIMEFVDERFGR